MANFTCLYTSSTHVGMGSGDILDEFCGCISIFSSGRLAQVESENRDGGDIYYGVGDVFQCFHWRYSLGGDMDQVWTIT
ncbi:hypothetical protein ID866_10345 [Astraeus odoratus]|nr:hypothetical protein ID866_10345 [Astraeus odoratus]